MKRVLVERRKRDRRKSERRVAKDESEEGAIEYVAMPISDRRQVFRPDDFEEGETEKLVVEHPVEIVILTIVQEIDYGEELRSSEDMASRR